MNFIVRYEHALCANETRSARRQIKHVALPEQTIGSVLIEDDTTVDLRGDLECDSRGNVRLDYARDHVRGRGLHQISQLVDDDNHVREFIRNDQLIVPRYFYWAVRCLSEL